MLVDCQDKDDVGDDDVKYHQLYWPVKVFKTDSKNATNPMKKTEDLRILH